jgi:CPA1 family monovalent cation:H+ antiporter
VPHLVHLEALVPELLLLSAIVAIVARQVRIPYTVALVLTGLVVGIGDFLEVSLNRDLIILVFLPPLLFDGVINMNWAALVHWSRTIALLAIAGTLVTAAVTAAALWLLTPIDWQMAILLAVIISPTDPVSVLANFKEHHVPGGLRVLVEAESVFNDALGVVLFGIALELAFPAAGHSLAWGAPFTDLARETGVGVAVGLAGGFIVHRLMSRVDDHFVEIMLSVVLVVGTFILADRLDGSGIIGVVVGALVISNYRTTHVMSHASRVRLADFWEIVAFMINSALFLLLGLVFHLQDLNWPTVGVIGAASLGLFLGRIAVSYGLLLIPLGRDYPKAPLAWRHAIFWGGLRGSVPVALALGLTGAQRHEGNVDLVGAVFGVVFVSLVLQGLTYGPLLQKLRLNRSATTHEELSSAHQPQKPNAHQAGDN